MIAKYGMCLALLVPGLGMVSCHPQEVQPSELSNRMWLAEHRIATNRKPTAVEFSVTSNSDAFVSYDEFLSALNQDLRLMMYLHGDTTAYSNYWELAFNSWRHSADISRMNAFFDYLNEWHIFHKCLGLLWFIKDSVNLYDTEAVSKVDSFERLTISRYLKLISKYGRLPFDSLAQLNPNFKISAEEKEMLGKSEFKSVRALVSN